MTNIAEMFRLNPKPLFLRLSLLAFIIGACVGYSFAQTKTLLLALNKQESTLAVIDPATMKVIGVVFSADGKTAFLSVVQPDAVLKIDLEEMRIAGRVETGQAPDGLAFVGK